MSAILPASATFAPPREASGLAQRAEYVGAVVILFLMSGALLAPVFSPDQNPDSVPWLRTIWLPVYGLIALFLVRDLSQFGRVAVGAALSLVLVGWALASSRWSIDPDLTVRRSVALLFTTLFGLHLAATYDWRRLLEMLAGLFVVLAIGTYVASLLFRGFAVNDPVHPEAWNGLWYEKNQLGREMTYGCLACACAALFSPERRRLWIAGTVLCVGAVVMSRSTTSILGVAICLGGLACLALLRRGDWVALVAVWAIVGLGGAFAGIMVFAPDLFFGLIGKDPSLTGRTDIWAAVLRQAAERPLQGYGFGAFWLDPWGPAWFIRQEVKWKVPHAHDGWLEILIELGAVGLAAAVLHFVISVVGAVASVRRGAEGYWALLFMAIFALSSVSEITVMQYNDLSWTIYIATMAKLFEWSGRASRPSRPVKLFPDDQAAPDRVSSAWP